MFRLWGKLVKDGRVVQSKTVVRPEEDTRTHKIFGSIEELCKTWDLASPIWLESNIGGFKKTAKTRFYAENFIEEIDFDFMEIQVIEEDT